MTYRADPVTWRGELVVHEVRADEQLVQEGEGDGEVGVEVEAVPGLVREPAPGGSGTELTPTTTNSANPAVAQRTYGYVVQEHRSSSSTTPCAVAHRVTGRGQDARACDQPDRREAEPTVRDLARRSMAEGLVEPRAAAHEHELDEGEVGAEWSAVSWPWRRSAHRPKDAFKASVTHRAAKDLVHHIPQPSVSGGEHTHIMALSHGCGCTVKPGMFFRRRSARTLSSRTPSTLPSKRSL